MLLIIMDNNFFFVAKYDKSLFGHLSCLERFNKIPLIIAWQENTIQIMLSHTLHRIVVINKLYYLPVSWDFTQQPQIIITN